jgi:hypothetical protein
MRHGTEKLIGVDEEEVTEYTKCQSFSPVIRIGSPSPLTPQASVAPPYFGSKWGTYSLGWRKGDILAWVEGATSDERTDTWYSIGIV